MNNEPKRTASAQIIDALFENNCTCIASMKPKDKNSAPLIEAMQWWNIGGFSHILELHHNGGYNLYRYASKGLAISSDIDYIKSIA